MTLRSRPSPAAPPAPPAEALGSPANAAAGASVDSVWEGRAEAEVQVNLPPAPRLCYSCAARGRTLAEPVHGSSLSRHMQAYDTSMSSAKSSNDESMYVTVNSMAVGYDTNDQDLPMKTSSSWRASELESSRFREILSAGRRFHASDESLFRQGTEEVPVKICLCRLLERLTLQGHAGGNELFLDQLMALIILANTVCIGVSCDVSPDWDGWRVIHIIFAALFAAEIMFRIFTWGAHKVFFGKDWKWGWFEAILVAAAWLEIGLDIVLGDSAAEPSRGAGHRLGRQHRDHNSGGPVSVWPILRIIRLVRITRLIQVLRFQIFGDLLMMVQGTLGGFRTLMWCAVLISFPVYAMALFLRETIGASELPGDGGTHFTSVAEASFTVFRCFVGNDCTNSDGRPLFVFAAQDHGWSYPLLYVFGTIFMTFGLFNVITAIYVENTVAAAKYNLIYQKRQRIHDQAILADRSASLVRLVFRLWNERQERAAAAAESSGGAPEGEVHAIDSMPADPTMEEIFAKARLIQFTPSFIEELRNHPRFQQLLRDLDVSDEDQLDLFETLDVDGGGSIDLEELIIGISKLRGDARRSDIVAVGMVLRHVQTSMRKLTRRVEKQLDRQNRDMQPSQSKLQNIDARTV